MYNINFNIKLGGSGMAESYRNEQNDVL